MIKKLTAKPLPEKQEQSLSATMDALIVAKNSSGFIRDHLYGMKSELESCKRTLGDLKEVVGRNAYQYGGNSISWHKTIDERMAAIDKILA